MERKLLLEEAFGCLRAALLEDGKLVELRVEEQGGGSRAGSIYKARVQNILPGIQAAFVDIGENKNAYLPLEGLPAGDEKKGIGQRLRPGQELLVQVKKEGDEQKGARVSARLALPGRLLVLRPFETGVGVSKRIGDEKKRAEIRRVLQERCPAGIGAVLRTAAQFESEETLCKALDAAVENWRALEREGQRRSAPCLLWAENDLMEKELRDLLNPDLTEAVVGGRAAFERAVSLARELAPEQVGKIRLYDEALPLFDLYNLETEIARACRKRVELKKGGFLFVEPTEALTVVDVNSGAFVGGGAPEETAFRTNLEAAGEIARQLRLRDVGGAVVVDFIDMADPLHRKAVVEALRRACGADRTPVTVHGMTRLGLVELTRRRSRQPLRHDLMRPCPLCHGEKMILKESMLLRQGLSQGKRQGRAVKVRPDLYPLARELAGQEVKVEEDKRLSRAFELTDTAVSQKET